MMSGQLPLKCDVMKRNDDPKRLNLTATAPLVLIAVTALVARLEDCTSKEESSMMISSTHLSRTRSDHVL